MSCDAALPGGRAILVVMFIKRLRPNNVLSFADCSVELRNLNVLIGPNGCLRRIWLSTM